MADIFRVMLGIYSAVSAIQANSTSQSVIANNLANVSTPGFKARSTALTEVGSVRSGGVEFGLGVRVQGTPFNNSQGPIARTGNPLDFAISGEGYFPVRTTGGDLAFTRNGSFARDGSGFLRTVGGDFVLGDGGLIQVPQNVSSGASTEGFRITQEGGVQALGSDGSTDTLDQISLAVFNNENGLASLGGGRFRETAASGAALFSAPGSEAGRLLEGSSEFSNVNIAQEMTSMILVQRAFEANVKTVQAADEMLESLNDLKR